MQVRHNRACSCLSLRGFLGAKHGFCQGISLPFRWSRRTFALHLLSDLYDIFHYVKGLFFGVPERASPPSRVTASPRRGVVTYFGGLF